MTRLIDADTLPRHGKRGGLVYWRDIENATAGAIFGRDENWTLEVARIDNGILFVDNSSGEYAEMGFDILYCPFCGARIDKMDKEERGGHHEGIERPEGKSHQGEVEQAPTQERAGEDNRKSEEGGIP